MDNQATAGLQKWGASCVGRDFHCHHHSIHHVHGQGNTVMSVVSLLIFRAAIFLLLISFLYVPADGRGEKPRGAGF